MKLIQFVLLPALLILAVTYFRWFRSAVADKLLIGLIFLCGVVFVLFPDLTTRISTFLGVGRGADLLLYSAIILFGYILLLLYSKIKKLEDQLADLVRNQALTKAENLSSSDTNFDEQHQHGKNRAR
jgi:hypothetical protein